MDQHATTAHCPFLGLADDRGMCCMFPSPHHRCYRRSPKAIDGERQVRFCLFDRHVKCAVYLGHDAGDASRTLRRRSLLAALVAALVLAAAVAARAFGPVHL